MYSDGMGGRAHIHTAACDHVLSMSKRHHSTYQHTIQLHTLSFTTYLLGYGREGYEYTVARTFSMTGVRVLVLRDRSTGMQFFTAACRGTFVVLRNYFDELSRTGRSLAAFWQPQPPNRA